MYKYTLNISFLNENQINIRYDAHNYKISIMFAKIT